MDESSTAAVSSLMADLSLNPAALELPSRTVTPSSKPARNPQRSRRRRQPFRFFDLPTELRILILEFTLFHPATIDLDPLNTYLIAPLIRIFLVSHRMHTEASQVFYSINTFRLFPIHGRFFHTKQPLLARLPVRYLALITTLELRLGPGWTGPPSGWKIANPKLRLAQLEAARSFRVFVEFDPASHEVFRGFRKSEDFYTEFCRDLLVGLFAQVGGIEEVHFDAYTSVRQNSL